MARGRTRENGGQRQDSARLSFEAALRQAADALRNNMDAAEYKHVALGLIFLEYISAAFAAKAEPPVPLPDLLRAMNGVIEPIIKSVGRREVRSRGLAAFRDTPLCKLICGQPRVRGAERVVRRVGSMKVCVSS
jgi:HsdM N-terminal domain